MSTWWMHEVNRFRRQLILPTCLVLLLGLMLTVMGCDPEKTGARGKEQQTSKAKKAGSVGAADRVESPQAPDEPRTIQPAHEPRKSSQATQADSPDPNAKPVEIDVVTLAILADIYKAWAGTAGLQTQGDGKGDSSDVQETTQNDRP